MAGLMDRAEQRKSLRRAGDADTDPASISASEKTGDNDSVSASDFDGSNTSDHDARNTSEKTSGNSGGKTSRNAGDKTSTNASTDAGRRRGPGRPAGPDRRAITVRVLAEHDQVLTEAWDEDGLRPQQVIDQALADWAKKRQRRKRD